MPDLSNNSFIPKAGPVKKKRGAATRQVFVFTIVSYVMIFATVLAVAGVYFYGSYINQQLENEITALDTEINSFNIDDMQEVLEFDNRLQQATGRLDKSVSVVSIFEALEAATIDTVQIESLTLDRQYDEVYALEATIGTDSFDSTIFQRGVYIRNKTIDGVVIDGVKVTAQDDVEQEGYIENIEKGEDEQDALITFTAELEVPLSAIPHQVFSDQTTHQNFTTELPLNSDTSSTAETSEFTIGENNEENI